MGQLCPNTTQVLAHTPLHWKIWLALAGAAIISAAAGHLRTRRLRRSNAELRAEKTTRDREFGALRESEREAREQAHTLVQNIAAPMQHGSMPTSIVSKAISPMRGIGIGRQDATLQMAISKLNVTR